MFRLPPVLLAAHPPQPRAVHPLRPHDPIHSAIHGSSKAFYPIFTKKVFDAVLQGILSQPIVSMMVVGVVIGAGALLPRPRPRQPRESVQQITRVAVHNAVHTAIEVRNTVHW